MYVKTLYAKAPAGDIWRSDIVITVYPEQVIVRALSAAAVDFVLGLGKRTQFGRSHLLPEVVVTRSADVAGPAAACGLSVAFKY